MRKLEKEEQKRSGSEEDVHKSMDNGGVIFDEESPVDEGEWREEVARMEKLKKDQEQRDRRDKIKVVVNE